MKKSLLSLLATAAFAFVTASSYAQGLSVNTTGDSANNSAMLDVSSTSKGVLVPRMTSSQRNAISSPATGLLVYQTDGTTGFYVYNGSAWAPVGGLPTGTATGQMMYWNGASWVTLTRGTEGQQLVTNSSLLPQWVNPITINVGMYMNGGKVGYILAPGDPGYDPTTVHGLIVADVDQSAGATWGCGTTLIGSSASAIGSGAANTATIVTACGSGTAASICATATINGTTGWHLPSRIELEKIWSNWSVIGGFTPGAYYWSSTEADATGGYAIGFSSLRFLANYGKTNALRVRAVKAF